MARGSALALVLPVALGLTGCAPVRQGVGELWATTREAGGSLLWDTALWTAGAGLLGLLLGILTYRLMARAGAYRGGGDWGQAARILIGILVPQLVALCCASAGFFEGLYQGSRRALTTGTELRAKYLLVGALGSEAVGGLYFFDSEWRARGSFAAARTALFDRLREFRDGEREIVAVDARDRLQGLTRETIDQALGAVREEAKLRFPSLSGGRTGLLAEALLSWLGPAVGRQVTAEASGWRVPFLPTNPFVGLPDRLPAVARRSGDPERISYQELATFLVEQAVVEPSLRAIRLFCRGHAALSLAPVPFLFLIPWMAFALARWLFAAPAPAPRSPP